MGHTKGPWEDVWLDDESGWIKDSQGNYLAEIVTKDEEGRCVSAKKAEANARLMASAPKLLEACKELEQELQALLRECKVQLWCVNEALSDKWDRSDGGFEAMKDGLEKAITKAQEILKKRRK